MSSQGIFIMNSRPQEVKELVRFTLSCIHVYIFFLGGGGGTCNSLSFRKVRIPILNISVDSFYTFISRPKCQILYLRRRV